ncbi:endonuclease/exonuclease/phosphatase family protein [Streptomyces sp. PmtG]
MTRVDTAEAGQGGPAEGSAQGPGAGTPTAKTGEAWRARVLRAIRSLAGPDPWKRGPVPAALALVLGLLMLLHAQITDRGGFGSLVETFLPWFGLCVPMLLAAALWRRSATAVVALLLPTLVWLDLFGGLLIDKSQSGGDLTVASHNVGADNPDPVGTARDLAASGADVLALQEITDEARGTYERELAKAYPHHTVRGTVGLWSKLPLSHSQPVDTQQDVGPLGDAKPTEARMADMRALRTTVATRHGPLAVYVAHLGSVRVNPRSGFWTDSRDRNAQALGEALAAERNKRVVLLGDLNGTVDDGALDGITSQLHSAQEEAGNGFGFTWPATFPVARIDQILVRGVEPKSSWLLPETGSDHIPVAAGVSW